MRILNNVERYIWSKYKYSSIGYVTDVYLESEHRANHTKTNYEGLKPGEFYFDYKSWGNRLGLSNKKMCRAIKELTTKNKVITQVIKGKKGVQSKYFLTRYEEQSMERNEENKKDKSKHSLFNGSAEFEERDEELKEEVKKDELSKHNNLDIKSNINIYSLIIKNLNEKVGTNYKATTKKTVQLIDSRIKEGYTVDDFIKVVNIKCEEWVGTELEKYLRPETLFGNKFEGYLNQKPITKDDKASIIIKNIDDMIL